MGGRRRRTRRTPLTATAVGGLAPTSRSPIVLAAHRLALRTTRPPLDRLWALAYRGAARAATAYVARDERGAATYVRGGVGAGDFVPGISDIDTAVVLAHDSARPGVAASRARLRWQRVVRALPAAGLLLDTPMVFDDADLRDLAGASAFTVGLEGGPTAGYFGKRASRARVRMLERPGLHGLTADWRLLSGPDRRPYDPPRDAQLRRIAAWLDLVYLWRLAFPVSIDATGPRTPALCVKLIAEATGIWLWLAHGERASGRSGALEAGLRRMPEEEDVLRRMLALQRALAKSPPAPLAEILPALVRISARIAAQIGAELESDGVTEVRLAGVDSAELVLPGAAPTAAGLRPLPLADWRALCCPLLPDESFAPVGGDPGDPVALGAAAACESGPYRALRADGLMVLPAASWRRSRLRAIQCSETDPVSFALAAGERVARFPDARGWSAHDTATRAVAEHRAWLGAPRSWDGSALAGGPGDTLAMLLTAARAALFLETVEADDPELPLTLAETVRRLGERSPAARTAAEDALCRYRELAKDGTPPPAPTVSALREVVLGLPGYAVERARATSAVRPPSAR